MNDSFDDLPWHDANLKSLYVDRQNPGENDIIKLLVEWPDVPKLSLIEFHDCYAMNAKMNFGVIACESILQALCIINSPEIAEIKNKWLKIGIDLSSLKCYKITTNSTNSVIDIFSLGFQLKDMESLSILDD